MNMQGVFGLVGVFEASQHGNPNNQFIQQLQAQPAIGPVGKNMDWPGAQEIADRLKKTLHPGLGTHQRRPCAYCRTPPTAAKVSCEACGAPLEA